MNSTSTHIVRVFGDAFEPMQSKSFEYRPAPHFKRIVKLFFSNDAELSLGVCNNTELPLHQIRQEYKSLLAVPPRKRLYDFSQELNNGVLRGMIKNLKTIHQDNINRTINLYAVIEYENK